MEPSTGETKQDRRQKSKTSSEWEVVKSEDERNSNPNDFKNDRYEEDKLVSINFSLFLVFSIVKILLS